MGLFFLRLSLPVTHPALAARRKGQAGWGAVFPGTSGEPPHPLLCVADPPILKDGAFNPQWQVDDVIRSDRSICSGSVAL